MAGSYAVPTGSLPRTDRSHRSLERVAASLGCTVTALLTGEGLPKELAQTHELFCIWASLQTDAEREHVLKVVCDMAAQFRQ